MQEESKEKSKDAPFESIRILSERWKNFPKSIDTATNIFRPTRLCPMNGLTRPLRHGPGKPSSKSAILWFCLETKGKSVLTLAVRYDTSFSVISKGDKDERMEE